ncbi:MATE family efflux transporter [Salinarimonas soli]|uniref:MATE family efflux transporter n=1 Tax=Salinarimonas soli TaxID=1638099 RepID=A0A5B2VXW1_9HYPH|nr:MATE family efflux transporter [Salinarimonas soli]KAA2244211.1 MATE family efflux transporter [Salinarimonas soli]
MDAPTPPPLSASEPRFVTGSTMRHVVVMTLTASVGLMAVFVVDLLSLLYVSRLGDPRLTAAVGLSTIVLFIGISINVGLMIAVAALVSRALGRGDRALARRLAASSLVIMAIFAGLVVAVIWPLLPRALALIGADDETRAIAARFIAITLPSNVLMALGMGLSGVLRAVGDAKRAMYVTLAGGIVTAGLDPLLIFGLGLGVDGAAVATVISRMVFAWVGWHGAVRVHDLVARPRWADVVADARPMLAIALPAVLTNIATPVASAFVAGVIARFGDTAIAGNAIVDRLTPVAFGGLFALSGAVGPILGQNWGALRFDRMRQALRDAVVFTAIYVGIVWAVLAAGSGMIVALFDARGLAAELVTFFCWVSGPMWFFIGLLFVANAAFNNLGSPFLSTAFNWGRATLGTVPFAYLGAAWAGPVGALAGVALGSVLFGIAGILTAFWTLRRLERAA